jgi:hypothetical protein
MKKHLTIIILIFVNVFVLSCCKKSNSTGPTNQNPIEGTWSETFQWTRIGRVVHIDDTTSIVDSGMIKTSTLTLGINAFSVTILPPHRILASQQDSIYTTYSPDTSYSGSYQIVNDTLILQATNATERFVYSQAGDSLRLRVIGKITNDGMIYMPMYSFLWGHTDLKISGLYKKSF